MINSMGDTATNVSGGSKFIRQSYAGTIGLERTQLTTSWTQQGTTANMFELTPEFFTTAADNGLK